MLQSSQSESVAEGDAFDGPGVLSVHPEIRIQVRPVDHRRVVGDDRVADAVLVLLHEIGVHRVLVALVSGIVLHAELDVVRSGDVRQRRHDVDAVRPVPVLRRRSGEPACALRRIDMRGVAVSLGRSVRLRNALLIERRARVVGTIDEPSSKSTLELTADVHFACFTSYFGGPHTLDAVAGSSRRSSHDRDSC